MPRYDYLCESGHKFEAEQSIKDDALTVCSKLGVDQDDNEVQCCSPCRRLISKASFKFKGGAPTPKHYQ